MVRFPFETGSIGVAFAKVTSEPGFSFSFEADGLRCFHDIYLGRLASTPLPSRKAPTLKEVLETFSIGDLSHDSEASMALEGI